MKDTKELISVIVPVYNVERYLEKCVMSIVRQTYRNLEIILVDDGSTDNSPALCDELAKKDDRIVVIHKENGGLSSARNAGIDVARGDLIGFVDSDDYIDPEMYEKMHRALTSEGADLCICGYQKVDEQGEPLSKSIAVLKDEVLTKEECFARLFDNNGWLYVIAPTKLYERSLLDGLRFEKGMLHEDEFFVHHLFGRVTRAVTISDRLYFYLERSGSIMNSISAKNHLCTVDAFYDRYLFFKARGYQDFAKKALLSAYGRLLNFIRANTAGYEEQLRQRYKTVMRSLLFYSPMRCGKLWLIYNSTKKKARKTV